MTMTDEARTWLNSRGIGDQVLARWPVVGATVPFGDTGYEHQAVVFNYVRDGERVNWKARAIDGKHFTQQIKGEQRFWNLDTVLAGPKDMVYITEGEMDALSLAEAGIADDQILCVPLGGPPKASESPEDARRYSYVFDALDEGLREVERFVLCTDNDNPGRYLKHDLVAILGGHVCSHVEFEGGCKDANDVLNASGPESLRMFLQSQQKEWPVVGLYVLDDLPEPPKLELWLPGFPEWENKIRLAPTTLSILTGRPGHGKTHIAQQIWFNIARQYDIAVALFSAETPAKPYARRNLRQFFHTKLERDMSEDEIKAADDWIRDHFVFIQHPNLRPTFPWLMDTIEAAVHRYGCRAAIVDPWNKLEADFNYREMNETQWIGNCLDEMLDAARGLDVHLQVLAHPAKPDSQSRKSAPDLYSISGSAHWANRADQGFCIHRDKVVGEDGKRQTDATFFHLKARFEELGWPCRVGVRLNLDSGRYYSTDFKTGTQKATAQ